MTRHIITTQTLLRDIEEKRRADARRRWAEGFAPRSTAPSRAVAETRPRRVADAHPRA